MSVFELGKSDVTGSSLIAFFFVALYSGEHLRSSLHLHMFVWDQLCCCICVIFVVDLHSWHLFPINYMQRNMGFCVSSQEVSTRLVCRGRVMYSAERRVGKVDPWRVDP